MAATKLKALQLALMALTMTLSASSHALIGEIEFSETERIRHQSGLPTIISVTRESMKKGADEHFADMRECGISKLFGFKSQFARMNNGAKEHFLLSRAHCSNPPRADEVKITSCELWTNRHLERGFKAARQEDLFNRIMVFFNKNDRSGIALGYALNKLGWKVAYWNTDVAVKHPTPTNRKKIGATPEDHVYSWQVARKRGHYYKVPVGGYMVNFSPSEGSGTPKDTRALEAFKRVPYFIGVAHGGFHVFPGYNSTVVESHSPYNPDNVKNVEVGKFGPPYQSPKGLGVSDEHGSRMAYYYSGIVIMPPGEWVWF